MANLWGAWLRAWKVWQRGAVAILVTALAFALHGAGAMLICRALYVAWTGGDFEDDAAMPLFWASATLWGPLSVAHVLNHLKAADAL